MRVPLGDRIKQARVRKKMSQRELAKQAGVNHSMISRIEDGTYASLSLMAARRIAQVLGVSLDYLAGTFEGPEGERLAESMGVLPGWAILSGDASLVGLHQPGV